LHFFASGANECELDSQGRIVVPPSHREYAGLKKEITVVGSYKNAEIWDREKWIEYNSDSNFEADEIAKAMEEFGL
ncbi:MAG: division/cell wall cluster transcriptional repressor MraZ, partial [Oscillospiraceae bacterium]